MKKNNNMVTGFSLLMVCALLSGCGAGSKSDGYALATTEMAEEAAYDYATDDIYLNETASYAEEPMTGTAEGGSESSEVEVKDQTGGACGSDKKADQKCGSGSRNRRV